MQNLIEILRAFRVLYKYIKFARLQIEKKLDELESNIASSDIDMVDGDTTFSVEDWKKLEPLVTGLIKLSDEIPARIKAIENAKELLDKEESSGKRLRGTKEEIPDSMIPGKDPE